VTGIRNRMRQAAHGQGMNKDRLSKENPVVDDEVENQTRD